MKTSSLKRNLGLFAITIGMVAVGGHFNKAAAQSARDPFAKASYMKSKEPAKSGGQGTSGAAGQTAKPPVNYGPPMIEARIAYFKEQRERAVESGQALPKVTSVLTLNELAVTGIFKTPRGYAAMIEAVPIKLSYTIYPGEKFFDGQLVAVEENRLVFKKVVKTGPKKFVASVEYKPLQQYTMRAQIEGTAPAQADQQPAQGAPAPQVAANEGSAAGKAVKSEPVRSLLDEMNSTPAAPEKDTQKKGARKPVKVAKNRN